MWNDRLFPKTTRPQISGQPAPVVAGGYSFEAGAADVTPGALSALLPAVEHDDDVIYDLDSGSADIKTYADLSEVQTAISNGTLTSTSFWRVAWVGDTYHGTDDRMGRVVQSRPTWRGVIPWPKLGATASLLSSVGGGALTTDGAGRPLLTVPAVASDEVRALISIKGAPPRSVRVVGQLQSNPVGNNPTGLCSTSQRREGDNTKYIQNFVQFDSGVWKGGYFYISNGAFLSENLDVDILNTSKYLTAKRATFHLRYETTGAQPLGTYTFSSDGDGESVTSANTLAGDGDFTVATQTWELVQRLFSYGVDASYLITGIEYETRL